MWRSRCSAALFLVLAAGCARVESVAPGARHPYTRPHVLRMACDDVTGLNPMNGMQNGLAQLSQLTMAYLVRPDARGEPAAPELAVAVPTQSNGGIAADGKTITYHLRRGVVWSDGAPFDAGDVVFTTRLILDPKTNVVSREGFDLIKRIDEPDRFTVVYHLKQPFGQFASTFFYAGSANAAILPKHLLTGKNVNTDPYNALPVGIGPFKYDAWRRGSAVELARNPKYFRGPPRLERVICAIVRDRNTAVAMMRTHELDLLTGVWPRSVAQLRSVPGLAFRYTPAFTYGVVEFNLRRPALQEVALRRALRLAVDRKTLNDRVRPGGYELSESVVPPASAFHLDIPRVPFDLVAANRLLDANGWTRGPDGVRVRGGRRLSFDLAVVAGLPDADVGWELMRSWFGRIGVELAVKHYPISLFFAPAQSGGILYGGTFDLAAFSWTGDAGQDLSDIYDCDRFPPAGQNVAGYCNPQVTAAIDRGNREYDPRARIAGMRFVQEQIFRDEPSIVMDVREDIAAFNDDLRGWPHRLDAFNDVLNVDI